MAMRSSDANKDHFTTRRSCDQHAPKMIWRYAFVSRELLRWIQTRIDLLFTMSENPQAFMRMKASEYKMRTKSVTLSDDSNNDANKVSIG
jgi:uncharacterized protein (DUF1786 family)